MKIKCKNLVFINIGMSRNCNVQYQLNHFKYIVNINCQEYLQVIVGYDFYDFIFLKISEQSLKVPPFLKLIRK